MAGRVAVDCAETEPIYGDKVEDVIVPDGKRLYIIETKAPTDAGIEYYRATVSTLEIHR